MHLSYFCNSWADTDGFIILKTDWMSQRDGRSVSARMLSTNADAAARSQSSAMSAPL